MKKLQILFTALVALVAGAFVSCTQEFQPGETPSGPQVCFNAETPSVAKIAIEGEGDKTFDIILNRVVTAGSLTVEVLSDCGDNATCFEIPSQVVFEDGKDSAALTVKVNIDLMDDTKSYPVEFLIPDSKITTPYGYDKISVEFKLDPWIELNKNKKAKIRIGDALSGFWKNYIDPNLEIDVKAYKHKLQENVFMVENPWENVITKGFAGASDAEAAETELAKITFTESNLVFHVDKTTNKVSIPKQLVANHSENGDMHLYSKYPEDTELAGEMADSVITFPKGALTFEVKTKNGSAWNGNINSLFRIIMPGGQVTDYSLAFAYEGMEVGVGSAAVAKLSFTYGNDVTGIKYLLAEGNIERNSDEAVAKLLAGTDPNIVSVPDFTKGGKEMIVKTTMAPGLYTIVAAPQRLDGNLSEKNLVVKAFYFSGLGTLPDHSCQLNAWVKKVSDYNPELSANYPDTENFVCHIKGEELKDAWMVVDQARFLPTKEAELIEYVKNNGTSLADEITTLNSAEGWTEILSAWENIEYTVAIYAVNDYDQGTLAKFAHKTDDIEAYAGELKLGKYSLTCEKQKSYNTFTLKHRAGSTTEFFVEDFCYEDGNQWYATYDAVAGTLTLSGERRGYEGASSFTKQLGYFKDEESGITYGYAFYSIDHTDDAEGQIQGTDPFVFTIDAKTKELNGANCKQLRMHMLDLDTGGISDVKRLHNYFNFTNNGTTIAPYVEPAAPTANSVVPFSSVNLAGANYRKLFVKNVSGSAPLRTVKTEVVR